MTSPTTDRRFGLVGNAALKAPVAVLAAGNITLSGQQTVDGVAVLAVNAAGVPDRVLCVGQTDSTQNGIWDVSTAAWTRSLDADGKYDLQQGSTVQVNNGASHAGEYWRVTSVDPITIGTTALTWGHALVGQSSSISFLQAGTGAVTRTVQDELRDRFSIKQFGAKGDGVTDDTNAFVLAGAVLRSLGGGTLVLPQGTYPITNPFWAYGINRWEMIGYGASIKNVAVSPYDAQKLSFYLNIPAETGMSPPAYDSGDSGTLIATANRGANSVTCLTHADASKFTVGSIYKITSRCIQTGGWPLNHAYYDFVTVTSANASTGVIAFTEFLRNTHRSDDIEAVNYAGAARIWSGNSSVGAVITEFFACRGVNFISSLTGAAPGASFYGARNLVVEDCNANYLYLGECDTATVRNCGIAVFEPDKHIVTLDVEGGRIDFLTQVTGVVNFNIRAAKVNRFSTIGARTQTYTGNFISDKSAGGVSSTPAMVQLMQGFPVKTAAFLGNTFDSAQAYTTSADKIGAVLSARGATVIASTDYTLTATTIQINKAATNVLALLCAAAQDQLVEMVGANSFAKIKSVYDDGTYYCLDVTYLGSTTGHTGIRVGAVSSITMKGNEYINCNYRYLETIKAATEEVEDQVGLDFYSVTYNSGLLRTNGSNTPEGRVFSQINGYVTAVEINVIRAYTGVDAALFFGSTFAGKYVNCLTTGLRVYNLTSSYGTKTGDDTGAITVGYATNSTHPFNQTKVTTGAVVPTGTADQQAIVQVTYRVRAGNRSITQF